MNFTKVKRIFADLADSLLNRRPRNAVRVFLLGLKRDVRQAFATASDPATGLPWAPRKDSEPHPLLIKTGVMMAAAIGAADSAVPSSTTTVVNLSGAPYFGYQQRGTSRMPARRYFGVSPKTRVEAAKALCADIVALTVGGR